MCGHPAPGIRHLGKVTLPLAKVKLPPSRSAGQYQQGREWGREPLARPGRRHPLWPSFAGNGVLAEYSWGWHLGVVPLGSSKPLSDQRGVGEASLTPAPGPPLLQALGTPPPLPFPPTQLGFPDALCVGPACPTGQAPTAKMDASAITEAPGLEPTFLSPRLNGV